MDCGRHDYAPGHEEEQPEDQHCAHRPAIWAWSNRTIAAVEGRYQKQQQNQGGPKWWKKHVVLC